MKDRAEIRVGAGGALPILLGYLHGSLGSGTSHFMAVLSLLLAGNPRARSIVELAPVVTRHNGWTEGRRFLLVPYHMIGSNDLESAILGGYADHVRRLHPQAPIPGFYLAEHLFRDADAMRARMGDEAFLGALNETAGDAGLASAEPIHRFHLAPTGQDARER